jgi:hypothetical protein
MGAGTADGAPTPAGKRWSDGAAAAVEWITTTFKLAAPSVLDPVPNAPPNGSDKPDATWIVPVHYHEPFDVFRKGAADRKKAVEGIAPAQLVDAQITALGNGFGWTNCLDVLLWWADRAEARKMITAQILNTITKADQLARTVPGASVRRILVSHSLGTAATTFALRHLGTKPEWSAIGGFNAWFTLANVAPFLIDTADVYGPPLLPGQPRTLVQRMVNARHECDPIPWLLPWRHWNHKHAEDWSIAWGLQEEDGNFQQIATNGVVGLKGGEPPEITHVHGFTNYLVAPDVATALAGAMRGSAFSAQELAAIQPAAGNGVVKLTCGNANALADLKAEVDQYIRILPNPPAGLPTTGGWLNRLLRAADLLIAAKQGCP